MSNHTATTWTTLPNHIVGNVVRLSVFVSPRLFGEIGPFAKLRDYQTFLNWPDLVNKISFDASFEIAGETKTLSNIAQSNLGEFSVDKEIWNILFSGETLVEPIEKPMPTPSTVAKAFNSAVNASSADTRRYSIHYRAQVFCKLVEETLAVQYRLGLSDLESEPKRPLLKSSDTIEAPDRLLSLAKDGKIKPDQFGSVQENQVTYGDATSVVGMFFDDEGKEIKTKLRPALFEPMSDNQLPGDNIRDATETFAGYHRRGIRNKRREIRTSRTLLPTTAYLNAKKAGSVPVVDRPLFESIQEIKNGNGSDFDFADSGTVWRLPHRNDVDPGFEVTISYLPNEGIPELANDTMPETKQAWAKQEATILYNEFLTIRLNSDEEANLDDDAPLRKEGFRIFERRKMRIRWTGVEWIMLDANILDFNSIISAMADYPAMCRRLGMAYDLEIPVDQIAGLFGLTSLAPGLEGKVWIAPKGSIESHPDKPSIESPKSQFVVGERQGTTDNGISLMSFAAKAKSEPAKFTSDLVEPLSAGFKGLNSTMSFQYDLDISSMKLMYKAVSEADPDNFFSTDRKEIPGSPEYALVHSAQTYDNPDTEKQFLDEVIELGDEHRSPALRTTGISVFADREYAHFSDAVTRDMELQDRFIARAAGSPRVLADPDDDDLKLNDLIAGYVVDVQNVQDGKWWSLCERQVIFKFDEKISNGRLPYLSPVDEGWISVAPETETDEQGNKQLRVSENLFRWDGGSLAAPPPPQIKPIDECLPPQQDDGLASANVQVIVEPKPLSLPQMRIGMTYRFRLRTVDLAGNKWPLEYANALAFSEDASPPYPFRRYEPINPPFFVGLQEPGPGEIFNNKNDCTPEALRGFEKGEMLVVRAGDFPEKRSWLVLPPEIKFQESVWYGMIDDFSEPGKAFAVLSRYCKAIPEKFDSGFSKSLAWPDDKKLTSTPYLPDIHAASVAFCYLPGGKERNPQVKRNDAASSSSAVVNSTTLASFSVRKDGPAKLKRPYSQPINLELKRGDKRGHKYNEKNRTLEVTLPPGEQQLIRVSCAPSENIDDLQTAALEQFHQYHLAIKSDQGKFIVQHRDGDLGKANWKDLSKHEAAFVNAMNAGQFWPISPQKNLYLVHAVMQPIIPTLKGDDKNREFRFSDLMKGAFVNRVTLGRAAILHDPELRLHRASTSRVDVYANWKEYSDGPGLGEFPRTENRTHHCFGCAIALPDLTIAPDDSHVTVNLRSKHDFPTTKHYAVKYHAVATTRYREYFNPKETKEPDKITIASSDSKLIHVLNTVPPPPPEIAYVLPLFIWENPTKREDGTIEQKLRRGLRVYMRRSWFASGEDERLALVFAPKGSDKSTYVGIDPNSPFPVTHWGTNPIWFTKPIMAQPTVGEAKVLSSVCPDLASEEPLPNSFACQGVAIAKVSLSAKQAEKRREKQSESKKTGSEVSTNPKLEKLDAQVNLAEDEVQLVDLAAYPVRLDEDKQLIYADIEFQDQDSYSALVKMSLARYQHYSAPYAHLSQPVTWMFQALSQTRVLSYGYVDSGGTSTTGAKRQFHISITGLSPGDESSGFKSNTIEIAVNQYLSTNLSESSYLPLTMEARPIHSVGFVAWTAVLPVESSNSNGFVSLSISEYEHVSAGFRRLVSKFEVPID